MASTVEHFYSMDTGWTIALGASSQLECAVNTSNTWVKTKRTQAQTNREPEPVNLSAAVLRLRQMEAACPRSGKAETWGMHVRL